MRFGAPGGVIGIFHPNRRDYARIQFLLDWNLFRVRIVLFGTVVKIYHGTVVPWYGVASDVH